MTAVAVIGPGSMGYGAACSLLRAGIAPHAFDLRPGPLADFAAQDGVAHGTAADAGAFGAGLPLSERTLELYRDAAQAGLGREDDAAVAKVLAARAGIALPGMETAS